MSYVRKFDSSLQMKLIECITPIDIAF